MKKYRFAITGFNCLDFQTPAEHIAYSIHTSESFSGSHIVALNHLMGTCHLEHNPIIDKDYVFSSSIEDDGAFQSELLHILEQEKVNVLISTLPCEEEKLNKMCHSLHSIKVQLCTPQLQHKNFKNK